MSDPLSPYSLPEGLPIPIDDGSCLHLRTRRLPDISLDSTSGVSVNLRELRQPTVLFFYPRTGIPGQPPSLGFAGEEWDSVPGARGCTPQSCGFRDLAVEFSALRTGVLGISTNTSAHQLEFKERVHTPFHFLSDADLKLTSALALPTFEFPVESGGPNTLIRRMAWYVEDARIMHVWYPVFPPDQNAATVLRWLHARRAIGVDPIGPETAAFVRDELLRHWHSTNIRSIGVPYAADSLPGFVATIDGCPAGHITLHIDRAARSCEVITLSSTDEGRGVGSALLDAAEHEARRRGCTRLFLTTTNDNLRALRFYQRRGMRIDAVHSGMIDHYRQTQPDIPLIGMNGLPLRDEIELSLQLTDPPPSQ